jgi:hypothetical protein
VCSSDLDYKIRKDSTIQLVIKLPSGTATPDSDPDKISMIKGYLDTYFSHLGSDPKTLLYINKNIYNIWLILINL